MSSIDERIVQMQFQNSQFEKGVKESLKTIEDLKKELKFKDAEKELDSLQKTGNSFSLSKMASDIESVSEKFSLLGVVGKRALENLTDSAYTMGVKMLKNLSIDQITNGFSKYADKTKSVQTIVNATGLSIGEVDKQLSRLALFTDETSYSFTDMVSNIGKFTSMNVPLADSVTAMEGIATWAAVSGQGINEASRAMYNLSQAMGAGAVKLIDWKSIENANMGTAEFKQTAIDTAIAMGVLKSTGKTSKGTAVTLENFSQTLQQGWFTSDVLLKTLEKYGSYANEVLRVMEDQGVTAAQAMEQLSDAGMELGAKAFKAAQEAKTYKEAIESVQDAVSTKWMDTFEILFGNYEEAKVLWTDLANWLYDVFAVSGDTRNEILKTWVDLGGREDLLKGLYDIFDSLFGIIQSVRTAFSDIFPDDSIVQTLLNMSTAVKEFGANMKETLNYFEITKDVITSWKTAWEELKLGDQGKEVERIQKGLVKLGLLDETVADGIFNQKTEQAVKKFQEAQGLVSNGIVDINTVEKMSEASAKAFNGELKRGDRGEAVKELQQQLIEFGALDKNGADGIFGPKTEAALKKWQEANGIVSNGIFTKESHDQMFNDDWLERVRKATETSEFFSKALIDVQRIARGVFAVFSIVGKVIGFVAKVVGHVLSLLSPFISAFLTIAAAVGDAFVAFNDFLDSTGKLDEAFEKVKTFFEPFGEWVQNAADSLLNFFGLGKQSEEAAEGMITFPKLWKSIKDSVKKTGIIDKVRKSFDKLGDAFKNIKEPLKKAWNEFKESFGKSFNETFQGVPDVIASVTESIGNFITNGVNKITEWVKGIPDVVTKLKDFWDALTYEGDPKVGKAPGLLVKIKNGFKSVVDFLFGEGDVESGKAPGILKRFWKLVLGDMEGYTEGLSEKEANEAIERINRVKDFFDKVGDAIELIFTGKINADTKMSEETIKNIEKFRISVQKIFEAIGLFITGNQKGENETSLGEEVQNRILEARNIFGKIGEAIKLLFTGNVSEDSAISDETVNKIKAFRQGVSNVFESIRAVFTGEFSEGSAVDKKTQENIINFHNTIIGVIEAVKNFYEDVKSKIVGIFTGEIKFDSLGDAIKSFWESLKKFFNDIGTAISDNFGNVINGIGEFISNAWNFIKSTAIWGIIIFEIVKITGSINNVTSIFNKQKQPLSRSMLEFAAAIGIIAAALWAVGQLNPEQFQRAIMGLGFIFVAMGLMLAACNSFLMKGAVKTFAQLGKAMLEFAIGIGLLAVITYLLGKFGDFGTLLNGILKLAIVMVPLIGLFYILNKVGATKIKMNGLWQLAILIGVMAAVAYLIGSADWKVMLRGIGLLALICLEIAGLMFVFGKFGGNIKTGPAVAFFIGLSVLIGVMTQAIVLLGALPDKMLKKGIMALTAIMGLTAVVGLVMALVGHTGTNWATMLVFFAGLSLVAIAMSIAINKVKDVDIGVMIAFVGSIVVLGVVFGILAAALSKIDPLTMLNGCLNLVLVFAALGVAIALLVNITANSFETAFNTLRIVGWGLEDFSSSMDNVKVESFMKAEMAFKMIGQVFKAANAINVGGIDEILTSLTRLGAGLKLFGALVADVSIESVDGIISVIDSAAMIADKVRAIGEVDDIKSILTNLGGAFKLYFDDLAGIQTTDVEITPETISQVFSALNGAEIDDSVISTFTKYASGDSGLSDFALGVENLSTAINKYATSIGSLDEGQISLANSVLTTLSSISSTLSNFEIATIFGSFSLGTTDLAQFSEDVVAIGEALGLYGSSIGTLDTDQVKNANDVLTTIAGLEIKKTGGLWGILAGNASLGQFASNMSNIAHGMTDYLDAISGKEFNKEKIENSLLPLKTLADIQSTMKASGGIGSWFNGSYDVGTFGAQLATFGEKLMSFSDTVAEFDISNVQGALNVLDQVAEAQAKIVSGDEGTSFYAFEQLGVSLEKFFQSLARIDTSAGFEEGTTFDDALDFLDYFDASGIVDAINTFASDISTAVSTAVTNISNDQARFTQAGFDLGNAFQSGVDTSSFETVGSSITNALASGISSNADTSSMDKVVNGMLKSAKSYTSGFYSAGGNFTLGLANGASAYLSAAVNAAAEVASQMLQKVKETFETASPSRKTAEFGMYFALGLGKGVTDYTGEAVNSTEKLSESMLSTARNSLGTLSNILAQDIDTTPTITPVVDMSYAQAAAGSISSLFGDQTFGVQSRTMANRAVSTKTGKPVTNQNGSSAVTSAINGTNDRISALSEAISNMKMVMDSGAVVGQIAGKMDRKLGTIATTRGRMG